jgi:hypothetical protein
MTSSIQSFKLHQKKKERKKEKKKETQGGTVKLTVIGSRSLIGDR